MGGLQGAVGWYMVKSGLVDRTDVSQYRLAAHLGIAVLILGYTLWLLFGLGSDPARWRRTDQHLLAAPLIAGAILMLIYLQILAGALVAGIDAGQGFNTWPLINGAFIPEGLGALSPWTLNLFENPLTVQFDHRMLAYTVLLASIAQAVWLVVTQAARKPWSRAGSRFSASSCCKPRSACGRYCSPCPFLWVLPIRQARSSSSPPRSIIFGSRPAARPSRGLRRRRAPDRDRR